MTKKTIVSLALSLSSFFSHAQDCFTLVWSDEFNGTSIDETKWNFENGTGYPILTDWGNGEVQYYSNRPKNIEVSNGSLKINAVQENFGGKSYSSGRIRSKGNFDFKYGRIEARIKIPKGSGLWPAFWLLPSENVFGGWPYSGEIDIMENFGQDDYIGSTIHYKDGNKNNQWNSQTYGTTHDEYHTFSAVWDQNIISFYSDWNWVGDEKPADLKGGTWPFNENFYLILNLALGGNAGSINGTTFPKTMEIDYVRVYQKTSHIAIQGPTQVYPNQTVSYTLPTNATATYNWTAPSGASILSGQGTNKVTLKWGTAAGNVLCSTSNWSGDISGQNNTCAAAQHTKAITTITKNCDIPLLNFDGVQKLVPSTADGVGGMESMYEKNISKTTINTSPLVGRFARVGGQQYDVLKLNFTEAVDVSNLRSELNKFKMDVYATSGTSIPVTIELVNRAKNTGYPNGIHSQLTATIPSSNSWQTLNFKYTNTPDWSIMGDQIDGINILFNSGSNTTSTYYFDNLRTELPIAYTINGPATVKDPEIAEIQNYSIPNETGSSYAWTVGDKTVISSGQNTNALNVKFNNGIYSNTLEVTQTNSMLCTYSTSKVVAVDGLTTISSAALSNSIQVFPNPMANELSIQTDLGTISEYKLLDAHGLLIAQGQVDKFASINTDALTAGIYFLNISNSAINQTYKVIKK